VIATTGKVILASQNRMLDCDSDGFKLVTPFFTVTSGVGCGPYRIGIPYWMRGGVVLSCSLVKMM
jgi:hypothetical protein